MDPMGNGSVVKKRCNKNVLFEENDRLFSFEFKKKVCVCVYIHVYIKYICVMKNDLLHHNEMLRAFVSYHGRS